MTAENFLNVRTKAILSVLGIIVVLSSVFLLLSIKHQKEELSRKIEEKKSTALRVAQNIQEHTFGPYKKRIVSLATTKEPVIAAFAKRDREQLQKTVALFYDTIKAENNFFHIMHFSLPDGTTLLRMHLPEVYGDDISEIRPMVMQVHHDKKQLSGYEVGRKGLFYRVIQPVFSDDKYIGSLEFGIRYQQLLEYLKKNVSPDVAIAIKKKNWEKADLVVAEKKDAGSYFLFPFNSDVFKNVKGEIIDGAVGTQVEFDSKTYSIISDIELQNHNQEPVAKVLVALDITSDLQDAKQFIINIIGLTLGLLFAAALVLHYSFGKLLSRIFNLNLSLSTSNLQLTEAKSYMENIISSMSDGLLVTDPDGRIILGNHTLAMLIGCELNELANRQLFDLFEQREQVKELFEKTKDKNGLVKSEVILCAANGHATPILLSISNLNLDEQNLQRQVCIVTDISDRKEAERILKSAHDQLELRVEIRTRELAEINLALQKEIDERRRVEGELRQAQKMEAIGTLAGGIAHDFNNILTAIIGYAELAKTTSDKTKIAPFLEEVLKAGTRAKDLVLQILTFSRQSKQEDRPVALPSIMKECLKLLRATIPTTIEITSEIDEECGLVLADPTQIHQIMMNLCTNAYQAMQEDGSGTLTVTLHKTEAGVDVADLSTGRYVKLEVCDTGPGMDPDTLERIFEPYFTTKEAGKGTGLGLAVVHGIVQRYGGQITVNSSSETGTCFTILLPCYDGDTEPTEISMNNEDLPVGGNEHILVIDDEKEISNLLNHMLSPMGYRITNMTDSAEALTWLQTNLHDIDLVITDMNMPKITGLDLAQIIIEMRADLPVILCTGYSDRINMQKAREIGLSGYLHKPLEKKVLVRAIRQAIDGRSS